MMENYEHQWPLMIQMHKYLAHTSKDGRRKHRKAAVGSQPSQAESSASHGAPAFEGKMCDGTKPTAGIGCSVDLILLSTGVCLTSNYVLQASSSDTSGSSLTYSKAAANRVSYCFIFKGLDIVISLHFLYKVEDSAKGKENALLDEGHRIDSKQAVSSCD